MKRLSRRRTKRNSLRQQIPVAGIVLLYLGSPILVLANPTGGVVAAGSATISSAGSTVTINQASQKAAINWQSFGIAKGETVRFVQPSATSVALNRVLGSDASAIYGTLSANGRVFLINPNGILFAAGSQVNVGGLVASTLALSDSDFMSGNYAFGDDEKAGAVINRGRITAADGGFVAFIGPRVANEGIVAAKVVGLAAGERVSLDFSGDHLLTVSVDRGAAGGSAVNSGSILADGGTVLMSAGTRDALLSSVVNNSGLIQARSVAGENGTIILAGSTAGNSGTLDASGSAAGQTGGTVKLLGDSVTLAAGARVDVSGDLGGGSALIGGAYQGAGSDYAATTTRVEAGATVNADAISSGDGGQVVVWANGATTFGGTISARGGSGSGDGGRVETSGKQTLMLTDTAGVNTTAAHGATGNWLLDPADFTIGIGATGANYWNNVALGTAITTSGVTIQTDNASGSDNGDINVLAPVSWSANTLTLSAYRNINIKATLAATGAAGLTMTSGTGGTIDYGLTAAGFAGKVDFSGSGALTINNNVYTVISDATGLQAIASSGKYFLGADIDASETSGWNSHYGFNPIMNFGGIFDGGGHTITGLTINRPLVENIGLFGVADGAILANVGLIKASITGKKYVGSLAGMLQNGSITASYASGSVIGSSSVGGLVGSAGGGVSNSYATGSVTGSGAYVGGLVGEASAAVSNSYATGSVTGDDYVGGLVGNASAAVSSSYATGSVSGTGSAGKVGGLVGEASAAVSNSYATGNVTGTGSYGRVGGLVGVFNANISANISNSYATGRVTGASDTGGLVGAKYSGTVTNSYWDKDTTGQAASAGGTGLTTAQMKDPANYSAWDTASVWYLNGGYTAPLLRSFLTSLGVSADSATAVYDGNAKSVTGAAYTPASGSYESAKVGGTLAWSGAANVGSYGLTGLYTTSQQGYLINYDANAKLTISPKELTLSGSRVYDGTTDAAASIFGASGTISTGVGTETLTLTGSGILAGKNAGTEAVSNPNTLALGNGSGKASNYTLGGATVSITPRILTATVTGVRDKTYNGTTSADGTLSNLGNLIEGELLGFNLQGNFSDKNVGVNKTITFHVDLNGLNAGNYSLADMTSSASITPAPLTASLTGSVEKVYDGTTTATLTGANYTLAGIVIGETAVKLNDVTNGSYADKNAGNDKSVSVSGLSLDGEGADNYTLVSTSISGNVGKITPASLTIAAKTNSKTYDGTTSAAATPIVSGGTLYAIDQATLSATYDDKNAGSGKTVTPTIAFANARDAGNYTITLVNDSSGVIDKAALTITAAANTKTYDGTASAAATPTVTSGKLYDIATLSAAYADKNAGSGKTVTPTITFANASDADNYTVAQVGNTSSAIAQATLSTELTGTVAKTYDGGTAAALTAANFSALSGTVYGADGVTLGVATSGSYDSKTAGSGKTVTVSGLTLAGADAANYRLAETALSASVGTIDRATLSTALTGTVAKTYDGSTAATLAAANYQALSGKFGNDVVTLGVATSGRYDNKNAGDDKTVTVSGLTLAGTDAANYQLASTSLNANVGTITPAALTITAAASSKTYDGTTVAATPTVSSGTLYAIDHATLSAAYADKNAGSGKSVTPTIAFANATDAANYTVTLSGNTTSVITPAQLAYVAGAVSRDYDQENPLLTGSVSGVASGESLSAIASGTLAWTTSAAKSSAAGRYAINGGGLSVIDGNYLADIIQAPGNAQALTIKQQNTGYQQILPWIAQVGSASALPLAGDVQAPGSTEARSANHGAGQLAGGAVTGSALVGLPIAVIGSGVNGGTHYLAAIENAATREVETK